MRMKQVRTLLSGRGLVESPRWHGDRLYFSDWSAGEVVAVDLVGRGEVIARVASLPLCTAWLPDGRLVLTNFADLQDEARSRLSIADLCHRVTVIATAPG